MKDYMRRILSMSLSVLMVITIFVVAEYASVPVSAEGKQTIYIDTSGIDARKDLTATQKEDLKYWILWDIQYNLGSAVGEENVEVTNDPAKEIGASRKVKILNSRSTPPGEAWGDWTRGSKTVNVYLGEFMDDASVANAFKTGGAWDVMKLANGVGHTSSHELGHSFSVGHNGRTGDNVNKMTKGGNVDANHRATHTFIYDPHTIKTIQKNWGKKPCKSAPDYDRKALIMDYSGEPLLPYKTCEIGGLDVLFSFTGPLATYFYFGIFGYDSDDGVIDGNSQLDFIYKSSMEGLGADAEMLTFFVGAHDYTQFLLVGAPGTGWENQWFPLGDEDLELYDFVQQPDYDMVARLVVMKWDVDGVPGVDVQVTLDANAFGSYSNPYNGFTYGYADPSIFSSYELFGPRLDSILMRFLGTPENVFAELDVGGIDIVDTPITQPWLNLWQDPSRPDIQVIYYYGGAKAYRTYKIGTKEYWEGIVNELLFGVNSWWTFLNAHTDDNPESGVINYGLSTETLGMLNPIYAHLYWDWEIIGKVYDSLLYLCPIDGVTMRPWVASSYIHVKEYDPVQGEEVSVLYFTLRKDVYWHDDQQLTADDVIFTMTYLPQKLAERGYPPPSWDTNVADINRIEKYDDFNIKVYYEYPTGIAPVNTGGNIILPEHIWKPIVDAGDPTTFAPDPYLIGSGPFKVYPYTTDVVYEPGVSFLLTANKPASNGYFAFSPVQNFIVEGQTATPSPNTSTYWVGASYVANVKIAVKIVNNDIFNLHAVTSTITGVGTQTAIVPPNSWVGLRFPYPIAGGIGATVGPILFNEQTTWAIPPPPGVDTWTEMIFFKVTCNGDISNIGDPPPGQPGHVNMFDVVRICMSWGSTGPYIYPSADINWDGNVGFVDALIIMTNFGAAGY